MPHTGEDIASDRKLRIVSQLAKIHARFDLGQADVEAIILICESVVDDSIAAKVYQDGKLGQVLRKSFEEDDPIWLHVRWVR